MAWKITKTEAPPLHKQVWAYDAFSGYIHLAVWHGDLTDEEEPRLESCEEHGDDFCFILWKPCQVPAPPSQKEIDAATD